MEQITRGYSLAQSEGPTLADWPKAKGTEIAKAAQAEKSPVVEGLFYMDYMYE
jgi:hypothetical protein